MKISISCDQTRTGGTEKIYTSHFIWVFAVCYLIRDISRVNGPILILRSSVGGLIRVHIEMVLLRTHNISFYRCQHLISSRLLCKLCSIRLTTIITGRNVLMVLLRTHNISFYRCQHLISSRLLCKLCSIRLTTIITGRNVLHLLQQ